MKTTRRSTRRRGASALEAALIVPVFLIFTYSIIEASHMIFVHSIVRNAARDAARYGTTPGGDSETVAQIVRNYCGAVVPPELLEVRICDASAYETGEVDLTDPVERDNLPLIELANAEERTLFMVQVKVQFDDVAFIPWPFTDGVLIEGRSFMRREGQ